MIPTYFRYIILKPYKNRMKVAFISDIHGNWEALETVLKEIDKMKIQTVFCVGDIVGYNANPNECVEELRKRKIQSVMGNHDYAIANLNTTWFNTYAAQAIWWTVENLKNENSKFIKSLPEKIEMKLKDYKMLIVHGSPKNPIWEYIYPIDVDNEFVKDLDYDIIVMGHTHVPFVKKIANKLVLNPGSVGQPRDSDPKASFAVLDADKFSAKIIRVDYDIETASKKIIKAGLPEFLAVRLHSGI